jgi:hypothetical protein
MNAAERFIMNHADMNAPELMMWLEDAATLQAAHPKISVQKDEWVPGAPQFREHKDTISRELEKASALNLATTRELEEATAAAVEDVNINASYFVLRAKHEQDDAWLHNNGYQWKEKARRNYGKAVSVDALALRAKNGPNIAEVTVSWDKDPGAGSYQLQVCKGHVQGEDSFLDHGYFKKVRTVIGNLERASWYYFRVRSVGHNETGPWSEPVGIIVT